MVVFLGRSPRVELLVLLSLGFAKRPFVTLVCQSFVFFSDLQPFDRLDFDELEACCWSMSSSFLLSTRGQAFRSSLSIDSHAASNKTQILRDLLRASFSPQPASRSWFCTCQVDMAALQSPCGGMARQDRRMALYWRRFTGTGTRRSEMASPKQVRHDPIS